MASSPTTRGKSGLLAWVDGAPVLPLDDIQYRARLSPFGSSAMIAPLWIIVYEQTLVLRRPVPASNSAVHLLAPYSRRARGHHRFCRQPRRGVGRPQLRCSHRARKLHAMGRGNCRRKFSQFDPPKERSARRVQGRALVDQARSARSSAISHPATICSIPATKRMPATSCSAARSASTTARSTFAMPEYVPASSGSSLEVRYFPFK